MNAHQASDNDKIFDRDVATEGRAVRDDITIADDAIVGDMTLHHQKVLITDSRDHAAARSAGIERDIFANRIAIANQELARLAFVFKILGDGADAGEGKDHILFAECGSTLNNHMRRDFCAFANAHLGANYTIGANFHIGR